MRPIFNAALLAFFAITLNVSTVNAASLRFEAGEIVGIDNIDFLSGSKLDATFTISPRRRYRQEFAKNASIALGQALKNDPNLRPISESHDPRVVGFFDREGLIYGHFNTLIDLNRTDHTVFKVLHHYCSPYDGALCGSGRYEPAIYLEVSESSFGFALGSITFIDWDASPVSTVPIPAAAFMFAPALLGLLGLRRKNRA